MKIVDQFSYEVKRQFQVSSYQLIPEREFGKVLEFLARWWERESPDRPVPQIFFAPGAPLVNLNRVAQ